MTDTDTGLKACREEILGDRCIDGGTCHHDCKDLCFRRECCSPFSDYVGPWSYQETPSIGRQIEQKLIDHATYEKSGGDNPFVEISPETLRLWQAAWQARAHDAREPVVTDDMATAINWGIHSYMKYYGYSEDDDLSGVALAIKTAFRALPQDSRCGELLDAAKETADKLIILESDLRRWKDHDRADVFVSLYAPLQKAIASFEASHEK